MLNPKKRYEESDHRSKTPGESDTNSISSVIQPSTTFLPKLSSIRTSRKAPFNIEVNGSHQRIKM